MTTPKSVQLQGGFAPLTPSPGALPLDPAGGTAPRPSLWARAPRSPYGPLQTVLLDPPLSLPDAAWDKGSLGCS